MNSPQEFRAAFYQAVVDDDKELLPCDNKSCEAGVSYEAIDYFANVAECTAEELFMELEELRKKADTIPLWTEQNARLSRERDALRHDVQVLNDLAQMRKNEIQGLQKLLEERGGS